MDDRARINYVDVFLGFATLVAIGTVGQWLFDVIGKAQSQVDPLTSVMLGLVLPLLVIALMYSLGESARQ